MELRTRDGTQSAQLNQVYAMGIIQSMKYELLLLLPRGRALPIIENPPLHQDPAHHDQATGTSEVGCVNRRHLRVKQQVKRFKVGPISLGAPASHQISYTARTKV